MSNDKEKTNYLKIGSDPDYIKLLWDDKDNEFKIDNSSKDSSETPKSPLDLRKKIEPWLTALFQSERLNLLVGSGPVTSDIKEISAFSFSIFKMASLSLSCRPSCQSFFMPFLS